MNSTHLILQNHVEPDEGEKCCICGCGTSKKLIGRDYFGDTFRDYREMKYRLSDYICTFCATSLKDVPGGVVKYIDGTEKTPKSEKRGLGWRFFSWVLVDGEQPTGATKAHCKELREAMKSPPLNKHFAIIIADSGQKQLIYRLEAQYIMQPNTPYLVQFETEKVLIDKEFWFMLSVADRISAVVGKMRILEPDYMTLAKCITAYGAKFFNDYNYFLRMVNTSKARLCAFLAFSKGGANE